MAHGYLVAQFFNPLLNHRDDGYGGALEGRMRFALEVLLAIRAEVARDIAVGVRLSANDLAPGGQGPADLAQIAAALRATGLVDFVSLALGHSASYPGSTQIVPPPPVALNAIADHLPDRPADGVRTIATTRIVDLEHAERLIAAGRADLVGMTRALIADPDLPRKARSGSRRVIECIGCNQACIGHYHAGEPIGCVVNPRTGRERRLAPVRRDARRVLVVGAGPAGVAAAVEAARGGDDVTLIERARGHRRPAPARRARAGPPRDVGALAATRAARARGRRRRAAPRGRGRRGDRGRVRPRHPRLRCVALRPVRRRGGRHRVGGDRAAAARPRPGAGRRLGRRLGRPGRRRGPGRHGRRGDARLRGHRPGRGAAAVPPQPLPRAPGRGRGPRSATTSSWPASTAPRGCATSSPAGARSSGRSRPSSCRSGAARRTSSGTPSKGGPERSGPATSSVRERSRRRSSRASWPAATPPSAALSTRGDRAAR